MVLLTISLTQMLLFELLNKIRSHRSIFSCCTCCSDFFQPLLLCSSRNHTHPMEGHWKFLVEGVLKAKFLEAMYENKLEFPVGRGDAKQKSLPCWEYGYFLKLHILVNKWLFWLMCGTIQGSSNNIPSHFMLQKPELSTLA